LTTAPTRDAWIAGVDYGGYVTACPDDVVAVFEGMRRNLTPAFRDPVVDELQWQLFKDARSPRNIKPLQLLQVLVSEKIDADVCDWVFVDPQDLKVGQRRDEGSALSRIRRGIDHRPENVDERSLHEKFDGRIRESLRELGELLEGAVDDSRLDHGSIE